MKNSDFFFIFEKFQPIPIVPNNMFFRCPSDSFLYFIFQKAFLQWIFLNLNKTRHFFIQKSILEKQGKKINERVHAAGSVQLALRGKNGALNKHRSWECYREIHCFISASFQLR